MGIGEVGSVKHIEDTLVQLKYFMHGIASKNAFYKGVLIATLGFSSCQHSTFYSKPLQSLLLYIPTSPLLQSSFLFFTFYFGILSAEISQHTNIQKHTHLRAHAFSHMILQLRETIFALYFMLIYHDYQF